MYFTCEPQAQVLTSYQLLAHGSTCVARFVSSIFQFSAASFSAVVSEKRKVGGSFRSFLCQGDTTSEMYKKSSKHKAKGRRRILVSFESHGPLVSILLLSSSRIVLLFPVILRDLGN